MPVGIAYTSPTNVKQQSDRQGLAPLYKQQELLPEREIPKARENWLPQVVEMWDEYWNSDVAFAATESAQPGIYTLFDLRDQYIRMMVRFQDKPIERTGTGTKLNPVFTAIDKLVTKILHLEDRYGLNPRSRIQLGIAMGQQQLTVAELNRMAENKEKETPNDDAIDADWEDA